MAVDGARGDSNGKARILLVDDHQIVRYALAKLIGQTADLEVCGEAADAAQGRELLETASPDLAVIDLFLDGDNGLELVEWIKGRHGGVKTLVLSIHDERTFAARALRAGAMGYVNKKEPIPAIIEAIRQVLQGDVYLSPAMANWFLKQVASGQPVDSNPLDTLSNREIEVFELLGRGLTTQQIARQLGLSRKTVETHRKNLKTKLGLQNSSQLSRQAFQWVLENRVGSVEEGQEQADAAGMPSE